MPFNNGDDAELAAIAELRTLRAVRSRTRQLLESPEFLQNFDLDLSRLDTVVDAVIALIRRDYASPSDIPPHSRWRHFEVAPTGCKPIKRVHHLLSQWEAAGVDPKERVRRLLDLFVVSVLLDAGAGAQWKYTPADDHRYREAEEGRTSASTGTNSYSRSEGLAIASLDWFLAGGFSSDPKSTPHVADSKGLAAVTPESLGTAFQVSGDSNPLVGVDGRVQLLRSLGRVCDAHPRFFSRPDAAANELPRPGNLLDFLLAHPTTRASSTPGFTHDVTVAALWEVVMGGFSEIWPPTRTKIGGVPLGDVWPSKAFERITAHRRQTATGNIEGTAAPGDDLLAFHKLSQWLTYSLMEPLSLAGIRFVGLEDMTGLAEYRNGGLFIDYGVITLREKARARSGGVSATAIPRFEVYDDVVVEWRALTVALLDRVGEGVRRKLGMSEEQLPLVKVLEAGTWKLGREIAATLRPETKGPPLEIVSDGTVF